MAKGKKVLNILQYVVVGIFFVICSLITISSINKENGVSNVFGYSILTVQTDSMKGTIDPGDMIVIDLIDSDEEYDNLKEGDIISFHIVVDGYKIIDTHTINRVVEIDGKKFFETKGDNEIANDNGYRGKDDVVGVYKFKVKGLGKVIDFLKSTAGFFIFVFTPMLVFIIYEVYRLITVIVNNKKAELVNETVDSTSEDVKNAIIQEYLEKMKKENEEKNNNENKQE